MTYNYKIRRADESETGLVLSLRREAEQWLHGRGIRQWLPEWRERSHQIIREGVRQGKTWLVFDVERAIATVTLNGPDLDFWRPSDDLESALYFYKLIVERDYAGCGLGEAVIDWVSRYAEDEGKAWVRLDCWRNNYQLQNYYRTLDFRHLRTETINGRESGALFQRPAGTVTGDGRVKVSQDPV